MFPAHRIPQKIEQEFLSKHQKLRPNGNFGGDI